MILGALLGFALFSPWSIAGAQICLGFGLIAWIIHLILSPDRRFVFSSLGRPIAIFLGVEVLAALLSPDPVIGLKAFRDEWIVLLFFLTISTVFREKTVRRLIDVLVTVTATVCLYAIWQHFAGWDLYRHRALRPCGPFFEATGLFGHHLTFGGYAMVVLMVSGCLFLFCYHGRRRVLYGLASLILALALLFSYARSAWLGLTAGILAVSFFRGRRGVVLGLIGLSILAAAALALLPSVRLQIGAALSTFQDPMNSTPRLQMWSASLHLIRDHPLLGAGLGQVWNLLPAYGCHLGYAHVHNDILNVAANAGLLGLAAFLWIWVVFLRMAAACQASHARNPWVRSMAMAGFGLLVAFLVAGLFQCYYTDAEDGMILWFCLGLVVAVCRMAADTAEPGAPTRPRTGSIRMRRCM